MRPRYADLFKALKDPDPARADAAYDALLFDRGAALPDLADVTTDNKIAVPVGCKVELKDGQKLLLSRDDGGRLVVVQMVEGA